MPSTTSIETQIHESIIECIGKTPIVRLNKIPTEEGINCELGKPFWGLHTF